MFENKTANDLGEQPNVESTRQPAVATLYYDGLCPLCQKEMTLLARRKNEGLRLLDIHRQWQLPASQREDMLRQLHLRLPDGSWLKGVEASVEAWRHTRFGRWLGLLRWPLVAPVVDRLYQRWAERRFERLYGRGKYLCRLPEEADNDS
ncbi:thiol-disulfide oxidoreductase DCC family protein [Marinimicrobium agarilyticum]|uniref:thiol-disulfide oxidoreductase DCC family protein n=1 Tax=Marinimicrobium agarilyticum TaxID=306546 RepID=UPI0003FD0997|nr:DUF393 domain-containing protein [Marinimicrobium agarilyticum]